MLAERLRTLVKEGADVRSALAYAKSMGRLSLTADERACADQFEAALEAMYLMAAADGEVAGDELLLLSSTLRELLDGARAEAGAEIDLPLLKLTDRLAGFAALLERDGLPARLEAVAKRLNTPESRCMAFCLASAIAFVDEFVAGGEAEAIELFGRSLGLQPDESQYLLREVHARMQD